MPESHPKYVLYGGGFLLVILVISAIIFLVFATANRNDAIVIKKVCTKGDPSLVFPGPGAVFPPGYFQGYITFHKTEPYIEWNFIYGFVGGTVTGMDIIGPVFPSNPLNGPLIITICDIASPVACFTPVPNVLDQKIKQTSAGYPIDDIVDKITGNLESYLLRVRTTTFPGGATVLPLSSLCG